MVDEGSDAAAVLVGMPEFVVRAAVEEDGEVWVLVETPPTPTGCPGCGTRAQSKGRRRTKVRDLDCGGRPVVLVWAKRRWRCPDPDCEVATWTERVEAIASRAVLTERARYEVFRLIGEEARSTAEVARSFGVAWGTAWGAFEAHARPAVDNPERIAGVEALGIDETGFLAATPDHPRIGCCHGRGQPLDRPCDQSASLQCTVMFPISNVLSAFRRTVSRFSPCFRNPGGMRSIQVCQAPFSGGRSCHGRSLSLIWIRWSRLSTLNACTSRYPTAWAFPGLFGLLAVTGVPSTVNVLVAVGAAASNLWSKLTQAKSLRATVPPLCDVLLSGPHTTALRHIGALMQLEDSSA